MVGLRGRGKLIETCETAEGLASKSWLEIGICNRNKFTYSLTGKNLVSLEYIHILFALDHVAYKNPFNDSLHIPDFNLTSGN